MKFWSLFLILLFSPCILDIHFNVLFFTRALWEQKAVSHFPAFNHSLLNVKSSSYPKYLLCPKYNLKIPFYLIMTFSTFILNQLYILKSQSHRANGTCIWFIRIQSQQVFLGKSKVLPSSKVRKLQTGWGAQDKLTKSTEFETRLGN